MTAGNETTVEAALRAPREIAVTALCAKNAVEPAIAAIGTRRTGALRVDLQQRQKCGDDDDADECEEAAFVPVREDGFGCS